MALVPSTQHVDLIEIRFEGAGSHQVGGDGPAGWRQQDLQDKAGTVWKSPPARSESVADVHQPLDAGTAVQGAALQIDTQRLSFPIQAGEALRAIGPAAQLDDRLWFGPARVLFPATSLEVVRERGHRLAREE